MTSEVIQKECGTIISINRYTNSELEEFLSEHDGSCATFVAGTYIGKMFAYVDGIGMEGEIGIENEFEKSVSIWHEVDGFVISFKNGLKLCGESIGSVMEYEKANSSALLKANGLKDAKPALAKEVSIKAGDILVLDDNGMIVKADGLNGSGGERYVAMEDISSCLIRTDGTMAWEVKV